MAAREHRVSRRVLLGAAWTFPLVLAAPRRTPGPSTEKWSKALAAFRRAQAIIDAAVSEPDQDRAVYPERLPCRQSKGCPARHLQQRPPPPAPHAGPGPLGARGQDRAGDRLGRLGADRRRSLHGGAQARRPPPGPIRRLISREDAKTQKSPERFNPFSGFSSPPSYENGLRPKRRKELCAFASSREPNRPCHLLTFAGRYVPVSA
jgi:hypothetical protein